MFIKLFHDPGFCSRDSGRFARIAAGRKLLAGLAAHAGAAVMQSGHQQAAR
jgi:hypothetical protein